MDSEIGGLEKHQRNFSMEWETWRIQTNVASLHGWFGACVRPWGIKAVGNLYNGWTLGEAQQKRT